MHHCPVPGAAITEAKPWEVSIGFTYAGLVALELPPRTLASFPLDFTEGMLARAHDLLVDRGESDPAQWEGMWKDGSVHAFVFIQTTTLVGSTPGAPPVVEGVAKRDELHGAVLAAAARHGIRQRACQDANVLVVDESGMPREHFGYADGIGNPDIRGAGLAIAAGGRQAREEGMGADRGR